MLYLRLVVLAVFLVLVQGNGFAQRPIMAPMSHYLCNFAQVKNHLGHGNYVTIRSGPSAKFRRIGKLKSGTGLYVCDGNGNWVEIYYSSPKGPCGPPYSTGGLDDRKAKACESGWVEENTIDILSG
jgi:hypothetical protein